MLIGGIGAASDLSFRVGRLRSSSKASSSHRTQKMNAIRFTKSSDTRILWGIEEFRRGELIRVHGLTKDERVFISHRDLSEERSGGNPVLVIPWFPDNTQLVLAKGISKRYQLKLRGNKFTFFDSVTLQQVLPKGHIAFKEDIIHALEFNSGLIIADADGKTAFCQLEHLPNNELLFGPVCSPEFVGSRQKQPSRNLTESIRSLSDGERELTPNVPLRMNLVLPSENSIRESLTIGKKLTSDIQLIELARAVHCPQQERKEWEVLLAKIQSADCLLKVFFERRENNSFQFEIKIPKEVFKLFEEVKLSQGASGKSRTLTYSEENFIWPDNTSNVIVTFGTLEVCLRLEQFPIQDLLQRSFCKVFIECKIKQPNQELTSLRRKEVSSLGASSNSDMIKGYKIVDSLSFTSWQNWTGNQLGFARWDPQRILSIYLKTLTPKDKIPTYLHELPSGLLKERVIVEKTLYTNPSNEELLNKVQSGELIYLPPQEENGIRRIFSRKEASNLFGMSNPEINVRDIFEVISIDKKNRTLTLRNHSYIALLHLEEENQSPLVIYSDRIEKFPRIVTPIEGRKPLLIGGKFIRNPDIFFHSAEDVFQCLPRIKLSPTKVVLLPRTSNQHRFFYIASPNPGQRSNPTKIDIDMNMLPNNFGEFDIKQGDTFGIKVFSNDTEAKFIPLLTIVDDQSYERLHP